MTIEKYISCLNDNLKSLASKISKITGRSLEASIEQDKDGNHVIYLEENEQPSAPGDVFAVNLLPVFNNLQESGAEEGEYVSKTAESVASIYNIGHRKADEDKCEKDIEKIYPIGLVAINNTQIDELAANKVPVFEYRKINYAFQILDDGDSDSTEKTDPNDGADVSPIMIMTKTVFDELHLSHEDTKSMVLKILDKFSDDIVVEKAGGTILRELGDLLSRSDVEIDDQRISMINELACRLNRMNVWCAYDINEIIASSSFLFSIPILNQISNAINHQSFLVVLPDNYNLYIIPVDNNNYEDALSNAKNIANIWEKEILDDNIFYYNRPLEFVFNINDVMLNR